ncbi:hypothetical protein CONPUDRAFT_170398 [Coniophora puteana RWD-64-598 SS2]|uniref:Arrestin C-terminal-like domain-containing protein n=1 Tax=Coniophora puteana (strain RWD-64-598) TaxID=741705 RepID=R7SCY1_CONPW|nr:uncharacterized protein CONPUDRAFT_170398 [Coniophora puteana RWD-64-598 SS2]EIW74023.1 hypothetical protein CONPUDRAFT_170398 [Coniophora puteana RWD-64-598 SS2]
MSQVKIELQAPPNADYVVGYPGIPAGTQDRPQSAVKGTVEIRSGPQGVKAKWVRIELKKIESLPGGGQANSYFDFVGSSPINLWQSNEEYSILNSQLFQFYIRVPESIPPSISLERNAGIRYELVATVCTLGKKGWFLRRRKTNVSSAATTINIDKHELHSTWPVYAQPETRQIAQEGLQLIVERSRTCFGPGDRVQVAATLKSESMHTLVLRGFEFILRETVSFRAGPYAKRNGPQVQTNHIDEQKVPLNTTLYPGSQHKAELVCHVPEVHTNCTVNAARHIDITYMIVVKATFTSGRDISMELPIMVTNWPRNVSEEAMRRIGSAPSLCVQPPGSTTPSQGTPQANARPGTGHSHGSSVDHAIRRPGGPGQFNTTPNVRQSAYETDELGELNYPARKQAATYNGTSQAYSPSDRRPGTAESARSRRNQSLTASINNNSRTVTNASEQDEDLRRPGTGQTVPPGPTRSPPVNGQWVSAEDEKRQQELYMEAMERVKRVQGGSGGGGDSSAGHGSGGLSTGGRSPSGSSNWPSAEQEKVRMYEKAQALAKQTQASGGHSPPPGTRPGMNGMGSGGSAFGASSAGAALYQQAVSSMGNRGGSSGSRGDSPQRQNSPSRGAGPVPHYLTAAEEKAALERYNQAKIAVDRSQHTNYASTEGIASPPIAGGPSSGSPQPQLGRSGSAVPHFVTAAEEKAALERYNQAKLAVDRNQNAGYTSNEAISSGPISYDALYPSSGSASGAGQEQGPNDPPPFDGPSQPQYMNEKERLRMAYEQQDAAAVAQQQQSSSAPMYTPPAPGPAEPQPVPANVALAEKELLRRRYEEQDAAAAAAAQQQQLPRGPPPQPPPPRSRSQPIPPGQGPSPGGAPSRPLTAAEEKALLRARYEAEERGSAPSASNGAGVEMGMGMGMMSPPLGPPPPAQETAYGFTHPFAVSQQDQQGLPAPPPLAPRPPASYIQATREEDERVRSYYDGEGAHPYSAANAAPPGGRANGNGNAGGLLDMRPFSPFSMGLNGDDKGRPA